MKTVLITGANRGIGLALTRAFLGAGWSVIAACRNPANANALAALGSKARLRTETLDVADGQSVAALAKRLAGQPLDLLVNNAGVYQRTPPLTAFDPAEWQDTFATNLFGPIRLTLALLPALRAGRLRQIVSISSALGSVAGTNGASLSYRSSKAALNMAMRSLSRDLDTEDFTVVLLSPGLVDTDLTHDVPHAKIPAEESAAALLDVITRLSRADNGAFLRHTGEPLPW